MATKVKFMSMEASQALRVGPEYIYAATALYLSDYDNVAREVM
jgi:hypothetical protein